MELYLGRILQVCNRYYYVSGSQSYLLDCFVLDVRPSASIHFERAPLLGLCLFQGLHLMARSPLLATTKHKERSVPLGLLQCTIHRGGATARMTSISNQNHRCCAARFEFTFRYHMQPDHPTTVIRWDARMPF